MTAFCPRLNLNLRNKKTVRKELFYNDDYNNKKYIEKKIK